MASNISVITDYKHFWEKIIQKARFAPSVHNIQPWEFVISGNGIEIHKARIRKLGMGDPTGRQTWVSIGIVAEHISLLLSELGYEIKYKVENEYVQGLIKKSKKSNMIDNLQESMTERRTDRSIYGKINIEESLKNKLISLNKGIDGTKVFASTDNNLLDMISLLTGKALGIAMSSPDFRTELNEWVTTKSEGSGSGIPLKSLQLTRAQEIMQKTVLKRGIFMDKEAERERLRWESASLIVAIGTSGDLADHWFNAGRVYARAVLLLTSKGISHATNAACIEASDFHQDIENNLGTNYRLQCLIRAGKGTTKPIPTLRLTVQELIRNY